ncbi:MAG: hypothetical protein ACHQWU_13210 [Gemmatimonadales bacterium]
MSAKHRPPTPARTIVSVDLGMAIDPTAISILEITTRGTIRDRYYAAPDDARGALMAPPLAWFDTRPGGSGGLRETGRPVFVDVGYLERLPLRVAYPDQVAHVAGLMRHPRFRNATLVVDSTGVGKPVTQMFERAGLKPVGVTITAGAGESRDPDNARDFRVSKLMLVSRLQAALHEGVLRIQKTLPDASALVAELNNFRGIFTDSGAARFGAREGAHDDMVLSLAIGNWYATREFGASSWGTYVI